MEGRPDRHADGGAGRRHRENDTYFERESYNSAIRAGRDLQIGGGHRPDLSKASSSLSSRVREIDSRFEQDAARASQEQAPPVARGGYAPSFQEGTLIHEFIGHATEETARRYPEYWTPVEQLIGKVLKDWTTADHEKFAKWVERYLSSSAGSITLGPMFMRPPTDPPPQRRPSDEDLSMTGKQTPEEAFVSRKWKLGDLPLSKYNGSVSLGPMPKPASAKPTDPPAQAEVELPSPFVGLIDADARVADRQPSLRSRLARLRFWAGRRRS